MLLIFYTAVQVRNSVRFAGKSRLNSERFQDVNMLSRGLPFSTTVTLLATRVTQKKYRGFYERFLSEEIDALS